MSHHIYTTPGFIVHSAPQGEAGKYFLIFTRDLGMIGATAQGVRFSKSKLRYYMQDFARSLFSVVKGKEVWRVIGAKELGEGEIREENKKLYVRVLSLLKRLLPGEEKNEKLFEILEHFYEYVSHNKLEKEALELLEYLVVYQILNSLGYVHAQNELETAEITNETLEKVKFHKETIIKEINNGLKESQL